MADTWRFGPDYAETLSLADGRQVRLRAIRSEDRAKMREGLATLSPQSRYRRFFTDKQSLSDKELDYLTEPDGVRHYAIVAGEIDEAGNEGLGAGVARFVAQPDNPDVAEPAIVVVDSFQGLGLGRALMDRLIACAAERGVQTFRSEVLARNTPMLTLLDDIAPQDKHAPAHGVVVCEFPVQPELGPQLQAHAAQQSQVGLSSAGPRPEAVMPFDRLLRAVAEGRAQLARRVAITEQWLGEQIFGAIAREDADSSDPGSPLREPGAD